MASPKTTGKARVAKDPVPAKPPRLRNTSIRMAAVSLKRSDEIHADITVFRGGAGRVIRVMRSGAPAKIVPEMANRLGITQDRLFERLRLPKSTLKGRISKGEALASVEQDRIYRANRVLTRALEVLEDEEAARAWVNRQHRSLGGEAPLDLLDTEAGYELVLDTLGRIEYGIFS